MTVITGDFNIASDSVHYPSITEHGERHDPFADTDPVTFHTAFLPGGEAAHRIDYLLLNGSATVLDAATRFASPVTINGAECYLSDHIALTVHIRLP